MTVSVRERVMVRDTPRVEHLVRRIDVHTHPRDLEESAKSTISQATRLARSQGVVAICAMPNTRPAITTAALVDMYLRTAQNEGCLDGFYLYIGATSNQKQLREAVEVVRNNPRVVGIKLYAGKSVGDLAVINEDEQRAVFRYLTELKYTGILAAHCEKESLARPELWIPENPATWNLARPPEMEVESAKDLIKFALSEGFVGHLHICHASNPQTVVLVNEAKKRMRISCAATPHHLSLSTDDMRTVEGMRYKVNPPIRERLMMLKLREYLKQGKIDWIETDHAPHRIEEKTYSPGKPKEAYMSGIPSLEGFAAFLNSLVYDGFGVKQVEELTYTNPKKVFTKIIE
jgi:dihydroorotase